MIKLHLDSQLINSALARLEGQKLEFRHGCILAKLTLPVGAVSAIVIPSFRDDHVLLTIPFQEIKGNITGKFFVSKVLSVFWNFIGSQIQSAVIPKLRQYGLGSDTISHRKTKARAGDVGEIMISLRAINRWLEGKHPRLNLSIREVAFSPEGADVTADLRSVE